MHILGIVLSAFFSWLLLGSFFVGKKGLQAYANSEQEAKERPIKEFKKKVCNEGLEKRILDGMRYGTIDSVIVRDVEEAFKEFLDYLGDDAYGIPDNKFRYHYATYCYMAKLGLTCSEIDSHCYERLFFFNRPLGTIPTNTDKRPTWTEIAVWYQWISENISREHPEYFICRCRVKKSVYDPGRGRQQYRYLWNVVAYAGSNSKQFDEIIDIKRLNRSQLMYEFFGGGVDEHSKDWEPRN